MIAALSRKEIPYWHGAAVGMAESSPGRACWPARGSALPQHWLTARRGKLAFRWDGLL